MRVVALVGPRQAGKSTLSTSLGSPEDFLYKTLDNENLLALAKSDPTTFLKHTARTMIIDEIQRAPELILPIKMIVDQDTRPGRFLITGSADVFAMRQTQDSLAGRIANLELLPLSQSEITGVSPTFISDAFLGKVPNPAALSEPIEQLVSLGGFPVMQTLPDMMSRREWMGSYIETMVARDVRNISPIHDLTKIEPLLQHLAIRAANELNIAAISSAIELSAKTTDAYIDILERLFLVKRVQPFFHNELKRLTKSPKLFFTDSGLLSYLRRFDPKTPPEDRTGFGQLLEVFVYGELMKQRSWADDKPNIYHLRSHNGLEVDFILEAWDRRVVAIEVKAGATIKYDWARPLKAVAEAVGKDFVQGIILHTGTETEQLGEKIIAVPISSLWGSSSQKHS